MKKINLTLLAILMALTGAFAQTGIYTGTVTATESTLGLNETLDGVSVEVKTGTGSYYAIVLQELDLGGAVIPSFEMDNVVVTPNSTGYTLSRTGAISFIIPEVTIPEGIPIIGGQTFTNVPVSITLLNGSKIVGNVLTLKLKATVSLMPPLFVPNIMIDFDGSLNAPPVPDFTASATTVVAGSTVQFTDLSTNNPTAWHWYFYGGTPAESTVKNPQVLYGTTGSYDVKLVVSNEYGSTEAFRLDYITVTVLPPVADFTADATEIEEGDAVSFTDLSTNNPTEWHWVFDGGNPQESSEQNPVIVYPTKGVYFVSLLVIKEGVGDMKLKENYITVNPKNAISEQDISSTIEVYPNPTNGELKVESSKFKVQSVEVFDVSGKNVLSHTANRKPQTALDISHLQAGTYFVEITTEAGKTVKKIVKE